MKIKKILHITGVRELGSGQRHQLAYEVSAAKKISEIHWDTIAYHSGEAVENFERKTPRIFDLIILRNLFFWLMVLKYTKQYDLILLRHLTFDPFSLIFSPFIKNRIGVHHSKEIDELKLVRIGFKGNIASFIERYTGKISVKNSLCVAGVTQEIALYQNEERGLTKPTTTYPNGIEIGQLPLAEDNRIDKECHILFICSYFSEWHGLDILLDAVNNVVTDEKFYLHLIGNLTSEQTLEIQNNKNKDKILIHKTMSQDEYLKIASKCDVGLGSLALYRKNLREASTLKVREMLAMGLPVYSGHKDTSLNKDFKYYYHAEKFDFSDLLRFSKLYKEVKRSDIRNTASRFIEKKTIMEDFIKQLHRILK